MKPFTEKVIQVIQHIPEGKVTTYGLVAALAGSPGSARQVSWILHSMSKKFNLPWHRVINTQGKISLKPAQGFERQKMLLETEGVRFNKKDQIDLSFYLWDISEFRF